MIPKKAKAGARTAGLLYYLYGPGRANEHTDPHMVAAWDSGVLDPAINSQQTITTLAMLLDAPVFALEGTPPDQHVYHVPVRLDPTDRQLSDAEWAEVAREIMDASGIAKKDDPMGARWVAVRHADDHIHIVATLARQDGRVPDVRRDMPKMQARARELEVRYGLRRLTSGDKTAKQWPTTSELKKAKRKGRTETPRETLQERVRRAAAGAHSDVEFFAAIESFGVRLKRRTAPDGAVTGYSVALPGDRTAEGRAVWFSGTRLASDLSLPRVRERWNGSAANKAGIEATHANSRASALQLAAEHVHQAAAVLGRAGDESGAGEMVALADFLTTYAAEAPAVVRDELRDAARAFERAGRSPMSRRLDSQASSHLRSATQLVALGASIVADGGEAAAALALMVAVALAVTAAMRWHQARQHAAQEHAAAQAGTHLRAATEVAYGATGGSRTGTGRRGAWRTTSMQPDGQALTQAYEPVIRAAIPHLAETVLGEAAWPALAATLRTAENNGYDPARILAEVATIRGFGDAESTAEVLVWRLQRRLDRDARSTPSHVPVTAVGVAPAQPASEADGRTVHWVIGHRDFRNEADVFETDFRGSGQLPEGTTPEAFARAKLAEWAASRGRTVNTATHSVSLYDGPPAPGRSERIAYLPEGTVEPAAVPAGQTTSTTAATLGGQRSTLGADEATPLGGTDAPTLGEAVRRAVPEHASAVLSDPASAALAAWLIKAGTEGHNPAELLAEVAAARDLADADSVAQVLTWRVQGRLRRDQQPAPIQRIAGGRTTPTRPARTPGEQTAAERAAREVAERRNQTRGPRR